MIKAKRTRPIGVIILLFSVFWLASWNGLRLGTAIFFWKTLTEYGAHPLYIAASGGVWLIAAFWLVWGLWQGKTWGWMAAFSGIAGYVAWYWLDRLVLQKPHANWPYALTATVVSLLIVLPILFLHNTRLYFQRNHD
jgi:hypothetical protein